MMFTGSHVPSDLDVAEASAVPEHKRKAQKQRLTHHEPPVDESAQPVLSEYEVWRLANIGENRAMLEQLGLINQRAAAADKGEKDGARGVTARKPKRVPSTPTEATRRSARKRRNISYCEARMRTAPAHELAARVPADGTRRSARKRPDVSYCEIRVNARLAKPVRTHAPVNFAHNRPAQAPIARPAPKAAALMQTVRRVACAAGRAFCCP